MTSELKRRQEKSVKIIETGDGKAKKEEASGFSESRRLSSVEKNLRHEFADPDLLETALTHDSYANEFSCESNERLEFLGDALLGWVVSLLLCEEHPGLSEGDLSKMKSRMVSGRSFAGYAETLGLGRHIRLGKGERRSGGRSKESNNADAFEAVMAAVYLDAGFEKVLDVARGLFAQALRDRDVSPDCKTKLQEVSQSRFGRKPDYRILDESGPDHEKRFTAEASVSSGVTGKGSGRTKKEAERSAAADALEKLGY